jgi:uncharacterized repeat protein (TIGR01451 family)
LAAGTLLLFLVLTARGMTITGFSPASGQPGNVVTITGSGFSSATAVEFNSTSPTLGDFTNVSDGELLVVVPAGATSGPLEVLDGGSGATSAASFLVAPIITGFSPPSGASPTVVSIFGANFVSNGTWVMFPGVTNKISAIYLALTEVAATVPPGAGNGPITVITSAGTNVSALSFLASPLPSITSFTPAAATNGATVTIFGGNFFSPTTVKFGSVTAGSPAIVSTTELTVTVPAGAADGPLTVSNADGAFTTTSNFLTGAGPIVTSFSPTVGGLNTAVSIYGFNLSAVTNVTFNGAREYIGGYGDNQLQVTLTNTSGTGPIKVTSPAGSFTTSTNFTNSAGPFIADFNPVLGPAGTSVTIDGLNFTNVSSVKFGADGASFSVTSDTQISATVPSIPTGNYPIAVTTGTGSCTNGDNFLLTGPGPVITSFSPTNGVRGTTVTLNGADFTNLSAVKFGGVIAAYQPPTSTTELIAIVPADAASGLITVANPGGTGSSPSLFYLQPWITALSAPGGIVNSTLAIAGRNLTNASSVQVNGVNYNFTATASQILATIPSNATTGLIEIAAPGGLYISTNVFAILPKIYSFSPDIGPAGTVVTITGTSLFDVTSVLFNGVSAPASNASANQVQALVPANAASGPLTVVTPYGNDISSNSFTATKSSLVLLTKTGSPLISGPGSNLIYTLQLTNEGPSIVSSVTVTDYFPNGLTFLSAAASAGSWIYTNETVAWSMPFLTNGTGASLQIVGKSTGANALTNSASVVFAEGNLVPSDGIAAAVNYVVSDSQRTLSIARLGNPPGLLVTWPLSPANFLLQESADLTPSTNWQYPANGTFVSNNLNTFTDSIVAPRMYYRLAPP